VTDHVDLDDLDRALAEWRQGDCVVGEQWFIHRFSPAQPLTAAAVDVAATSGGVDIFETPEAGLVVLSQTCDIVRRWRERPFVVVAPLVAVAPDVAKGIARGHRPRYAFVPGVSSRGLVADLDRSMTVEKAVIAPSPRVRGCATEEDATRFAQALARNRARFAFPDDFSELVDGIHTRLVEKHDKRTAEGEALRNLREIRIAAAPSWDAKAVDLVFMFIRDDDDPGFEGTRWHEFLAKWLALVPPRGRYRSVDGLVIALGDLSAREYLASAQLDLDHVTSRPAP
jgi:hypothetical protein